MVPCLPSSHLTGELLPAAGRARAASAAAGGDGRRRGRHPRLDDRRAQRPGRRQDPQRARAGGRSGCKQEYNQDSLLVLTVPGYLYPCTGMG